MTSLRSIIKIASIIIVASLLSIAARAQTVIVTSSQLADSTGALANGALYFQPTDGLGHAIAYRKGGGGVTTNASVLKSVTNGGFSITLPDTTLTAPANICFSATLQTKSGAGLGPGYSCLQPHYTAAGSDDWCQAGVCNLDNYVPNVAPIALVQAGPQGLQGIQGIPGPTGPTGSNGANLSYPGVTSDGTNGITVAGAINGAVLFTQQNPSIANFMFGNDVPYPASTALGNLAIGLHALQLATSGGGDLAIGWDSQMFNISGENDVSVGEDSLKYVTGSENVGFGYTAGYSIAGGNQNVAVGNSALYKETTGSQNTAVGYWALQSDVGSNDNTAVGFYALKATVSGANTALGFEAGYTYNAANANTSGVYNTFLGYGNGPGSPTQQSYMTILGAMAFGNCSDCIVLGRSADTVMIPSVLQLSAPMGVAGTTAQSTCNSANAGVLWYSGHTFGAQDSEAICAADASNIFAWHTTVNAANTYGCKEGYDHIPCELPAYEVHLTGQTATVAPLGQALPSSTTGFASAGATYRITSVAYCTAPGTSSGGTLQLGLGALGGNLYASGNVANPFFGTGGNCTDGYAFQSIMFGVQASSPQADYLYGATVGGSPTGSWSYVLNTVVELISVGH